MKRLLPFIAFLLCLASARAATITFTFTNSLGNADTNAVIIYPISSPIRADGGYHITGVPVKVRPNSEGMGSVRLMQGNYVATNAFLGQGIIFDSDNSLNTYSLYDREISGGNVFVTRYVNTNSAGGQASNVLQIAAGTGTQVESNSLLRVISVNTNEIVTRAFLTNTVPGIPVAHATTADSASNATNLNGLAASAYAKTNAATARASGLIRAEDLSQINMRSFPVRPPRMFFEPWVLLHTNVNQTNLLSEATNIITRGYYSAGWNSILVDEPWMGGHDANGNFFADTNRFPSGIDYVITNLHNMGFEVGFFFSLGTNALEGPGSGNFIEQDATNALSHAMDFVYLVVDDNGWGNGVNYHKYRQFVSTVRSLGSDMDIMGTAHEFEPWLVDELGAGQVWVFDHYVDNWPHPTNFYNTVDDFATRTNFIRPGHYIMHGWMGATVGADGSTFTISGARSTYAMMSMFHAPLSIINTYLDGNNPPWKTVQTNQSLVRILRDSGAIPPSMVYSNSGIQIWKEPLKDSPGTWAVCALNRSYTATNTLAFKWSDIGLPDGVWEVKDGWAHTYQVVTTNGLSTTLPPYDAGLWFLTPWSGVQTPINSSLYSTATAGSAIISGLAVYNIPIVAADSAFIARLPINALSSGSSTTIVVNANLLLTNTTPWKLQPAVITYNADGEISQSFVSGINVSGTNSPGIMNLTSTFTVRSNAVGGFYQMIGFGTNTSTLHFIGLSSSRK